MRPLCTFLALFATACVAAVTDTIVAQGPFDFVLSGGASVANAPLNALRSGNPGQHTIASFIAPLNPGVELQSVEFEYSYDMGFGAAGSGLGSNFTVSMAGSVLYESPHLNEYAYDANRTNFSTPIPVRAEGLSVRVPEGGVYHLEIAFDNNGKSKL